MTKIKTKRERVKFASDNVTGACPEVLNALLKANDEDKTPYGNDELSKNLQNKLSLITAKAAVATYGYIGKKDKINAEKTASQTLLIGFLSTIILTILGVIYGEELLSILGAEGQILTLAHSYLRILTSGLGLVIFSMFFRAILAGEGETEIPMIIGLIGTILNLILDPILIFTFNYGVRGAAFATIISQIVMVLAYLFIIFVKKSSYISFNFRQLSPNNNILKKIFQIGIPSSLSMLIISFGQVVMNKILVNYSTEAVAAYQIVSRLDMLLFLSLIHI